MNKVLITNPSVRVYDFFFEHAWWLMPLVVLVCAIAMLITNKRG